jgi:hypothetical protein
MDALNPEIAWEEKLGKECLRFTFQGKLTEEDATSAIRIWRAAFAARMGKHITLIWNCQEMTGYDTAARTQWQQTLKDLRDQIETIWLISDSRMIRMGAAVMALFSSLNIKPVDSEAAIVFSTAPPNIASQSKQKST